MGRALILGSVLLVAAAAASAPDIIFVLADDLGFNEVGFQNASRGLVTPELDRLAGEGVILTQYYVQPICSPTRSALMTGRYTGRLGTQSNVIYWDTPWGVALEETFLAENLKDTGYETAIFGKWHLGMFREAYLPTRRGFDAYAGYLQGCESAWTHVSACCAANSSTSDETWTCQDGSARFDGYDWWAGTAPDASVVGDKSVDVVRARAEAFLRGRGAAPYFLYLPFQSVHSPLQAPDANLKKFPNVSGNVRTLAAHIDR